MIKLVQLIMLKCLQIINWHSKDVITKDWLIILNRSTGLSFEREKLLDVKKKCMGDVLKNNTWKFLTILLTSTLF